MSSAPSDPRARSLAARITTWYVVAFAVSLGALVGIAASAVHAVIADEDELVVQARVERHLAVLSTSGLPGYQLAYEQAARLGEASGAVRVRDAGGTTLYERGDLTTAMRTASRATRELRIEVGSEDDPWRALLSRLRPGMLALLAGAIALAVGGGFYVTRRALAPIRDLAATPRDVSAHGDLSRRVPERGTGDELDELSALFNRVLDRNGRLVRGMRDALDNVAHDLRTPLTRLRGSAELALRAGDPDMSREALADAIEETDRVLAMLRTLMDISEAETGIMRLDRAPVSLQQLAREAVDLYAHVAEDAGVELELAGDDTIATVDAMRMRQAISNLVDNAIKYTPAGGRVELATTGERDVATIRVRDTGEGIPADALPRIWDRLYRADPSRATPGLGLGLSLVKAIVTAHGGSIDVESAPAQGSTFTIRLPATGTVE